MSLRIRLTLSIIAILLLFSVNVGTDSWVNSSRNKNLDELQQAISSQLQTMEIQQRLEDLFVKSFSDAPPPGLEPSFILPSKRRVQKSLATIKITTQELEKSIPQAAIVEFSNVVMQADMLVLAVKTNYLDTATSNGTKNIVNVNMLLAYQNFGIELEKLEDKLVEISDKKFEQISTLESLTRNISTGVFIVSILLTIGLGTLLIRYTNNAFKSLKKGSIIIGGGNFDYKIPVIHRDEVGETAEAFNAMSDKLRQAMADVKKSKEDADFANDAKSDFLANMSHELRTPLNAIIGYSEMMLEEIDPDDIKNEDQQSDLKNILIAGKHLLNQINDVLDFSKIESGNMTLYSELFDSNAILTEVIATITPLAGQRNNTLIFSGGRQIPFLENDATKFRHIFINLLSNACKFSENDEIRIEASLDRPDNPTMAIFTVSDRGIGMTEEQSSIIFEAFRQADSSTTRKYGGTGLGLTLCKQYCDLMGSQIFVDSAISRGTTFTVHMPLSHHQPN
jgi:signal transduction histidine kinase